MLRVEPAHERTLRRLIRQLTRDPRGALVFAVCADLALRERIEAELAATIPWGVIAWDAHPASPWDEVLTRQRELGPVGVVSVHYDAMPPAVIDLGSIEIEPLASAEPDEPLLRLNLGRDIRARERVRLIVWVRGPGPLDRVRRRAPDLWAHRTGVAEFRTAADATFEQADNDWRPSYRTILGLQQRMESGSWLTPGQRFHAWSVIAQWLDGVGRLADSIAAVGEMRRLFDAGEELSGDDWATILVGREAALVSGLMRWPELEDQIENASRLVSAYGWPRLADLVVMQSSVLLASRGSDGDAVEALERLLKSDRPASLFVWAASMQLAFLRLRGGEPIEAYAAVDAALLSIPSIVDARDVDLNTADLCRGDCAEALGRPDEALAFRERAAERSRRWEHWDECCTGLLDRAQLLLDLGLPGVARADLLDLLDRLGEGLEWVERRVHRGLSRLAIDLGDAEAACRHADAALALHDKLPHAGSIAAVLDDAAFARELVRPLTGRIDVSQWPRRIDESLENSLDDDSRDRALLERAKWALVLEQPSEAAALAERTLPFRRAERGPGFIVDACVVAAAGRRAGGDLDSAKAHLLEARDVLLRLPESHRAFGPWTDLHREFARLEQVLGDRDAAWAALADALSFAHRRRLKVEQMRLLLDQARLGPDTERGRIAAEESLRIASELGYLRDEGEIRLELARQAFIAGDRMQARSELAESEWLLSRLGPPDQLAEARRLAQALHSD